MGQDDRVGSFISQKTTALSWD